MKVAVCQMDIAIGDAEANRRKVLGRLREGAARGAGLVVFPECALSGYCLESREEAAAAAVEATPAQWRDVLDVCDETGAFCVLGFIERDGGRLFNTAGVFGPGGSIGKYRKVHLPTLGVDRFVEPGDLGFPVFELPIGRVSVNLCYDQRFPEAARAAMLGGAQIVVVPTNEPDAARDVGRLLTRARAFENRVFYVWANRAGTERGTTFMGESSIVDPFGQVLAAAGPSAEETIFAEIDPTLADRKRTVVRPGEYEIDLLADRRPDCYGNLTQRTDE